jgi:hypothetical protein
MCHSFLHDIRTADRTNTVIHELSHLYQQTSDDNDWSWSQDTFIKYDKAGLPEVVNGVPQYTNGLPEDPLGHADTLAEFTMKWYVP